MTARWIPAVLILLGICAGCDGPLHNLQPHRLWRLNQTPSRQSSSYYSIQDDVLTARPRHSTDFPAASHSSDRAIEVVDDDASSSLPSAKLDSGRHQSDAVSARLAE